MPNLTAFGILPPLRIVRTVLGSGLYQYIYLLSSVHKLAGLYDISVDDLIQLTLSLDRNIYYDAPAPTQSGEILDDFLKYLNSPENQKKYQHFTYLEKELLYYFDKLTEIDKKEIIEFTKIKARKQK